MYASNSNGKDVDGCGASVDSSCASLSYSLQQFLSKNVPDKTGPTTYPKLVIKMDNGVYTEPSSQQLQKFDLTIQPFDGVATPNIKINSPKDKKPETTGLFIISNPDSKIETSITFKGIKFSNLIGINSLLLVQDNIDTSKVSITMIDCTISGGEGKTTVSAQNTQFTFQNLILDTNIMDNSGLQLNNCNAVFTESTFTGNVALNGMGAGLNANGGTISFDKCKFQDNKANKGAAIYSVDSLLTVSNSEFNKNSLYGNTGSSIYFSVNQSSSSLLTVSSTVFSSNTETAVVVRKEKNPIKNDNTSILKGCTFTQNSNLNARSSSLAGSLYSFNTPIKISDSTFTGDNANFGASIYLGDSTMSLNNVSITGDTSQNGAIYTYNSVLNIFGSLIKNNKAKNYGSAIYCQNSSTISITETTISGNTDKNNKTGLFCDKDCSFKSDSYFYQCESNRNPSNSSSGNNDNSSHSDPDDHSKLPIILGVTLSVVGTDPVVMYASSSNGKDSNNCGYSVDTSCASLSYTLQQFTINNVTDINSSVFPKLLLKLDDGVYPGSGIQLNRFDITIQSYDNVASPNITFVSPQNSQHDGPSFFALSIPNTTFFSYVTIIGVNFVNVTGKSAILDAGDNDPATVINFSFIDCTIKTCEGVTMMNAVKSTFSFQNLQYINNKVYTSGMNFTNCQAQYSQSTFAYNTAMVGSGSILAAVGGNYTFDSCVIDSNSAKYGSIYTTDAMLSVTNSSFYKNTVQTNYFGSAIYFNVIKSPSSYLKAFSTAFVRNIGSSVVIRTDSKVIGTTSTIDECSFSDNSVNSPGEGSRGASLYNYKSPIYITSTTFMGDRALYGASIANYGSLTLYNVSIKGGVSDYGGAIYTGNSMLNITGSTIQNNRADYDGGAIYCYNSTSISITGSTITGNTDENKKMGLFCSVQSCTIKSDSNNYQCESKPSDSSDSDSGDNNVKPKPKKSDNTLAIILGVTISIGVVIIIAIIVVVVMKRKRNQYIPIQNYH
eukprot:gene1508-1900_t